MPERRRHHLALACVTSLCADITARGHVPTRNCPVREYVQYAVGSPVVHKRLSA
ncbi:hypothetical protein [Streptomyces sp. NPDC004270]